MNLFFPGNPFHIHFFLRQDLSNFFLPVEGPPQFFFLDFLRPQPQIINGRPLTRARGERQFRIWNFCHLTFGFGILEPFKMWIWDFLVFEIWILDIET